MSFLPSMPYKWRIYLHGLVASILNSIGSAGSVVFVDPEDFNPVVGGSWLKLGLVVLVASAMSFFTYLKAHPIPDPDKDTDAVSASREQVKKIQNGTGDGGMR